VKERDVGSVDVSQYLRDGNLYLSSNRARKQEERAESSVERLQEKLHSLESLHSKLMEKSSSLEESLQTITQERDELRIMSEQSSQELRRALENLQDDQRADWRHTFKHVLD